MSFFDIFSVKSIDNVVDAVIDTGDALIYTDEEKASMAQLRVETKLKMLPLYEPFKLAQRYIAFAFTGLFIASFIFGSVLLLTDAQATLEEFLKLVATFNLGWIMMAVISFFFSGGMISSFKGKQ